MHSSIINTLATTTQNTTLVVFTDNKQQILTNSFEHNDYIATLIKQSEFKGKVNDTFIDYRFESDGYKGLLLVGVGDIQKITANNIQEIAHTIFKQLGDKKEVVNILVNDIFSVQQFTILSRELLNASYQFNHYKSDSKENKLTHVNFITNETSLQTELDFTHAVFTGQSTARDLGNQPANVCFPEYIADQAEALAKEFSDCLNVEVLGEAKMEELGMGCFLSVSKGSVKEGKIVTFDYVGAGATNTDSPIVLVGKGVTFDSGGISLKAGLGMEEMKFDMCGAASVFGTIRALCEAKLPIRVVGSLACAENMPAGNASRPGDIVTSMSGKTVEILNTDAEGRLVLSDTLTYIGKYNPSIVIDMATLTGACIIALGHVRSALYTQDDQLASELIAASDYSHDRIWHMPMDEDYQEQILSPCADLQNIGGRTAGSITAACFLSNFTKKYRWAHLDIAGTAWTSGQTRNASGRPVPLLMQYIRNTIS